MKKNFLVFAAVTMSLLFTIEVHACRCTRPTIEKSFEKATAIFSGEVIKLDFFRSTLKVRKMWKGGDVQEIVMLTGTTLSPDGYYVSSSCDFGYIKGERYLIYAYSIGDNLQTSFCDRSIILKDNNEDIPKLEKLAADFQSGRRPIRLDLKSNIFEWIQGSRPLADDDDYYY